MITESPVTLPEAPTYAMPMYVGPHALGAAREPSTSRSSIVTPVAWVTRIMGASGLELSGLVVVDVTEVGRITVAVPEPIRVRDSVIVNCSG
ncbi:MAG: hypothetical protein QXX17_03305 [Conexivisphaerales archaeon]